MINIPDSDHSSAVFDKCTFEVYKCFFMSSKPIFFEVDLNWLTGTRGVIAGKDANGTIHVATPPEFGGSGKPWTPEHLLLSAITSCFMTTFLVFEKKFKITINHLECHATGEIQVVEGKLSFTRIDVFPKIYIPDESMREMANLAMEKTHKYCLVANAICAPIVYHDEVVVGKPEVQPTAI